MPGTLAELVEEIIGPLIEADQGELYIVELKPERVALHLRGRFSGCPGNHLAIQHVIEPALRAIAPECRVVVTSGELVPDGAQLWKPPPQPPSRT